MPKRKNSETNEDNKRTRLSLDEKKKILLLLEEISDLGMTKAAKIVSAKMEKRSRTDCSSKHGYKPLNIHCII